MQERKPTSESEDSEEIAAALAAVYAYLDNTADAENEAARIITDEACSKSGLNAWGRANLFEGINQRIGKVDVLQVKNASKKNWRYSLARRWTPLFLGLFVSISLAQSATAFERIQYVDKSESRSSGTLANPKAGDYASEALPGKIQPSSLPAVRSNSTRQSCPIPQTAKKSAAAPGSASCEPSFAQSAPSDLLPNKQSPQICPIPQTVKTSTTAPGSAGGSPAFAQSTPPQTLPVQGNCPIPQAAQKTAPQAVPACFGAGARATLRVALGECSSDCEIIAPDGAEIIDEQNKTLIAIIPAQSRWQVSLGDGSSRDSDRLTFQGNLASVRSAKVVVAGKLSGSGSISDRDNYVPASYVKSSPFAGKTITLSAANPRFALPFRAFASPSAPPKSESQYLPATYKANANFKANADIKAVTPPVVQPGYLIKAPEPDGILTYQGKSFRGSLLIKARPAENPGFLVINKVDLEDYLLSVVPSEMPASWNLESLKAQSIAARSYALANLNKHGSEGYDLKATTEDQVYLGIQTETENSNRAVAETEGVVLKHDGKIVSAFFHSSGGGFTELAEHVWTKGVPYLKSVPDFDDHSPHFAWNKQVPVSNMEETLRKQGKDVGAILGIFALARTPSQRVQTAMIAGTLQTLIVSGEELRKIMQVPSTVFNIGQAADAYLVAGRGFGHGLGMSQWGAKYLSEQGYNAAQILSYYYKDVTIQPYQFGPDRSNLSRAAHASPVY